jgi:hypothetical protein
MRKSAMMVRLAMGTTVESTMIKKKPTIIAHSVCQGFVTRHRSK